MRNLLLILVAVLVLALPSWSQQSYARAVAKRTCEIHIWGSGASQALTATTDNEVESCKNKFGIKWTITSVDCYADAGSPTIMVTNNSVSDHNVLSGNLTCGTASWAAGSMTGTGADKVLAADGTLDINIVTGSTAHTVRVVISGNL